jgi:ATP-dependent Lhr-like helicase
MDLDGLLGVLRRIADGDIRCVARDLPEPSPLAHEILSARPYAFLDDAPLEERRTQAVQTRRSLEASSADDLGALDQSAITRVRDEAWPDVRNADELHDALLTSGFLTDAEIEAGRDGISWQALLHILVTEGRAASVAVTPSAPPVWVATERVHETQSGSPDVRELVRSRLGILGPVTAEALAAPLGVSEAETLSALAALEGEGVVLRGRFSRDSGGTVEWCDRRLLARIHRYTLNRLRAEIEPVSAADFMRFLLAWQRVAPGHRVAGLEGVAAVVEQLDGFELPAGAWETDVLSARCEEYDPALLDTLCLTGRVGWGRVSADGRSAAPIRSTPIALFLREHMSWWLGGRSEPSVDMLTEHARSVLDVLRSRGASFFPELVTGANALPTQVEEGLAELAAAGLVTSDGFTGLRALITPSAKRKPLAHATRRQRTVPFSIEGAGRWALLARAEPDAQSAVERHARTLLRRYGVIFRRLLDREGDAPLWRELLMVYRRLEARGEIRGGRFVAGMAGEQFALPEAVGQLRSIRREPGRGELIVLSGADPLNLTGIITPGDRVPALAPNRVLYEDGVPVLAVIGGAARPLAPGAEERLATLAPALVRKWVTPALRAQLAMSGRAAATTTRRAPRVKRGQREPADAGAGRGQA